MKNMFTKAEQIEAFVFCLIYIMKIMSFLILHIMTTKLSASRDFPNKIFLNVVICWFPNEELFETKLWSFCTIANFPYLFY